MHLLALAALAAAAMLPLAAGHPSPASAAGDCTISATLDADELAFLTLINDYRGKNGLAPLKASYTLSRASAWKSQDLAVNAYFAHDDLSRTWVQRVRDCGYGFNAYMGENIAAGYPTAQAVFDGWKASPGHNANMLGTSYTAIGIGKHVLPGSPYGTYWTTNFGSFSDGFVDAIGDAPAPIASPTPTASPALASSPTPTTPTPPASSPTPTASPTTPPAPLASPTRIATPRPVSSATPAATPTTPSTANRWQLHMASWWWWRFFFR